MSCLSSVLLLATVGGTDLQRGIEAFERMAPGEAIKLLESAKDRASYSHQDYVRLYEQLGVAYAYVGEKDRAMQAFDMLLALEPGHAVSYTLSPKVTFAFERSRKRATQREPPTLDVSWPRGTEVTDPLPIALEVVADPKAFLKRAKVFVRSKKDPSYREHRLMLAPPGSFAQLTLPPAEPEASGPLELELYVVALDNRFNEVLHWGSSEHPRRISLAFREPSAWYEKWWVWVVVASATAALSGTVAYLLTREPAPYLSATLTRN